MAEGESTAAVKDISGYSDSSSEGDTCKQRKRRRRIGLRRSMGKRRGTWVIIVIKGYTGEGGRYRRRERVT